MDDISAMINGGDMTVLENAIGGDAANAIKLIVNLMNAGTSAINTVTNPSVGASVSYAVSTVDSGVSAVKNKNKLKDKQDDQK